MHFHYFGLRDWNDLPRNPLVKTLSYIVEYEEGLRRGDTNGDGVINIADPVFNLNYQFSSGPSLCLDSQDTNDDGAVNIADPVYSLSHQFSMGPPPPAPFPGCGFDPTPDMFGCDVSNCP